jgi:hypothetical protein
LARALIVGCGCRGRELGALLRADGWMVRGSTRCEASIAAIEAAGLEAAMADPDRIGEILDLVADVTVLFWLMGNATGKAADVDALHGPRLERLLEELVDTPVRGVVYEAAGEVAPELLERGREIVEAAGRTWRIPGRIVSADPADPRAWVGAMGAAAQDLISVR